MPTLRGGSAALLAAACLYAAVPVTAQITGAKPTTPSDFCPAWAASPLPQAMPGQSYSASLGKNVGAVKVEPTIPIRPALPPGFSAVGSDIKGTTTPAAGGSYEFKATFSSNTACPNGVGAGASGFVYSHTFTLEVRDLEPPRLTSFTVDQPNLGAGGGNVRVSATATDNFAVRRAMLTTKHPDGHSGSTLMPGDQGNMKGDWQITIPLPVNTQATPAVYAFTISVEDLDGNVARGGPVTVTVAPRAAPGAAPVAAKAPASPNRP